MLANRHSSPAIREQDSACEPILPMPPVIVSVCLSRPYLGTGVAEIDADAAFQQQFEEGVRESVERERRDRE